MVDKAKTAFEKFRLLTKRLIGVPKAEADQAKAGTARRKRGRA